MKKYLTAIGLALVQLTSQGCADRASFAPSAFLRANYQHYAYDAATSIPDGDPWGVRIGPVTVPDDGLLMSDLVLEVSLTHQYTGDLELRLCYLKPRGGGEIVVPVELYRARSGDPGAIETFAYPDILDGTYFFRDEVRHSSAGRSPDPLAEPGTPSFSAFDGVPKGGHFYLVVIDTLHERIGTVSSWAVNLKNRQVTRAMTKDEVLATVP